jgi:hypothetical protein
MMLNASKTVGAARLNQRTPDRPHLTSEQGRARRRVNELKRFYYDRFPDGMLPNNELGVKYARYMARTMAFSPIDEREAWLDRYAPWLIGTAHRVKILRLGPFYYSRFALGERLELDAEDRERLGIITIEPSGFTPEQCEQRKREKAAKRQEKRRRKDGAKPRHQWLAEHTISRSEPWKVAGYRCRRTWERHGKASVAGPSRSFLLTTMRDAPATNAEPVEAGVLVSLRAHHKGHRQPDHALSVQDLASTDQERRAA